MKSLIIPGGCPYNTYQERCLQEVGVDAENYERWGIHLPDHTEKILAQKPDIIHLQWPEAVTQIQDQTLSFVPKIVAMMLALLYLLPWTLQLMIEYSTELIRDIPKTL